MRSVGALIWLQRSRPVPPLAAWGAAEAAAGLVRETRQGSGLINSVGIQNLLRGSVLRVVQLHDHTTCRVDDQQSLF